MDFFAIASLGTYPTPTPTGSQRAAFAISWGVLSTVYESIGVYKFPSIPSVPSIPTM